MMAKRKKITTQVAKDDSLWVLCSTLYFHSPQPYDKNVKKRPHYGPRNDEDQGKREGRLPVLDVFREYVIGPIHPLFRS